MKLLVQELWRLFHDFRNIKGSICVFYLVELIVTMVPMPVEACKPAVLLWSARLQVDKESVQPTEYSDL